MSLMSSMSSGPGSKIVKTLVMSMIGLAVLALVLMDVRGVVSGGPGMADAATVNGKRISARVLQMRLSDTARSMNMTPAQAAQAGIAGYVMQSLISEELLKQGLDRFGLRFSDADLAREVRAMMTDPKGDNSPEQLAQRYQMAIRSSGMNEREFEDNLRTSMARRIVLEALQASLLPDPLMDRVSTARAKERRDISVITIPVRASAVTETPDDATLQALYEREKAMFTSDETRDGRLLTISLEDLKKRNAEDPDAVMMEIEDAFAGGESVDAVVKTYGLKTTENFENKTGDAIENKDMAEAMFSLDSGEVSNGMALPGDVFGFVVLDKITPAVTKPLDDVREELTAEWRQREAVRAAQAQAAALQNASDPLVTAKDAKLDIETRNDVAPSDKALAALFDGTETGKAIRLDDEGATAVRLAVVTNITPGSSPDFVPEFLEADAFQKAQGGEAQETLVQMLSADFAKSKIDVNERLLQQLAQPAAEAEPAQ